MKKPKFRLSRKSKRNLEGVHPDLVAVVKRAIELTTTDFMVLEGLRTLDKQREYVKRGVSKTLNSRHLTGHAVDLVAFKNGELSWDWGLYFLVAQAVKEAAEELNVSIIWGGNWHVPLTGYDGTTSKLYSEYQGTFRDGPHFELSDEYYS